MAWIKQRIPFALSDKGNHLRNLVDVCTNLNSSHPVGPSNETDWLMSRANKMLIDYEQKISVKNQSLSLFFFF